MTSQNTNHQAPADKFIGFSAGSTLLAMGAAKGHELDPTGVVGDRVEASYRQAEATGTPEATQQSLENLMAGHIAVTAAVEAPVNITVRTTKQ